MKDAKRYPLQTRKPRVYADAQIPVWLIAALRRHRWKVRSAVEELGDGASDEMVRRAAQRARMVLLTNDDDFWDDRQHPLAETAGILIIPGPPDRLHVTLAKFHLGFLRIFKNHDWREAKARVTPDGFSFKRRGWARPKHFRWDNYGVYVEVEDA